MVALPHCPPVWASVREEHPPQGHPVVRLVVVPEPCLKMLLVVVIIGGNLIIICAHHCLQCPYCCQLFT